MRASAVPFRAQQFTSNCICFPMCFQSFQCLASTARSVSVLRMHGLQLNRQWPAGIVWQQRPSKVPSSTCSTSRKSSFKVSASMHFGNHLFRQRSLGIPLRLNWVLFPE